MSWEGSQNAGSDGSPELFTSAELRLIAAIPDGERRGQRKHGVAAVSVAERRRATSSRLEDPSKVEKALGL
jgi:hypothetical protein